MIFYFHFLMCFPDAAFHIKFRRQEAYTRRTEAVAEPPCSSHGWLKSRKFSINPFPPLSPPTFEVQQDPGR
jgi:hypothetical protein